jgi:hypothetical protein
MKLLRCTLLIAASLVASCNTPTVEDTKQFNQAEVDAAVLKAVKEAERAKANVDKPRLEKPPAAKITPEGGRSTQYDPEPVDSSPNLCWQDYCPCEPPQGGADAMLCRKLRAGQSVPGDIMAAASGMRDVRAQLKDHEDRYGKY